MRGRKKVCVAGPQGERKNLELRDVWAGEWASESAPAHVSSPPGCRRRLGGAAVRGRAERGLWAPQFCGVRGRRKTQ